MANLRVLLVDDHGVVREGVRFLIDAQPDMEAVGEAADGETACRLARELAPDLAVLDVSMPVLMGDLAASRIKADCPAVKVVALTVHEDAEHLRRLLKAGVSGYILKLATGEEFVRALRAVAAGGLYIDPAVAGKLVDDLVEEPRPCGPGAEATLTDRESQVLLRVAQGYSNKEIAAQLDISVKTVETHKLRSMEKLGLRGRAEAVKYALRRGWLSPD